MAAIPAVIRKVLRPFVPRRLRDCVRNRRLLRQVRSNVDVAVDGRLRVWRWLATTPATYRVGSKLRTAPPGDIIAVPPGDPHGLAGLVYDHAPVAVAAHAAPPPWRRRGTAAAVEPIALAASSAAMADIGGTDDDPVPALFDRFEQAGHRVTVVPEGRAPGSVLRIDPIDAPLAVVLATVPMHDVGGGSRGAQLTGELLRRGFTVCYVARFGVWGSDIGLRHIHPRLEQYDFPTFDAATISARARHPHRLVVCELPEAGYAALVAELVDAGFRSVYDVVDMWADPALGLDWYSGEVERRLVADADAVVASAPSLVEHVESMGGPATLVPNGVNELLFSGDAGDRPADLPDADTILGYHGSLYGSWFDWDSLTAAAEGFPDAAVTIIGDAAGSPPVPGNVHFLGVKAQFQLAPYIGRYTVGLVPFTVTSTTHAVSPLKAFECLAMGVPVAAPPLRPLEELVGVYRSDSLPDAVAAALAAPRPDGAAVRRHHGWGERLARLLGAVGMDLPDPVDPTPRFELRPAVEYSQRLLRRAT